MTIVPSILTEIITEKHREVKQRKQKNPRTLVEHMIAELSDSPRGFYQQLATQVQAKQNAVIAEIKKASPSKGIICKNFDPEKIATSYSAGGATCLSVLTDEKFFQGSEFYLDSAREACQLPIIRKDFIIDSYQIYESRAMGADCILLIAACLTKGELLEFSQLAHELGMDVLLEVHNAEELEKSIDLPVRMIGINNRDLNTFEVDLSTTLRLAQSIADEKLVITESGIVTKDDVQTMNEAGIYAFLIGETLMRHSNPGEKLKTLFTL